MSSIEEIECAIKELPKEQLAELRSWFMEFDAKNWDKQIEQDIKNGKLNVLAQAALKEYKAGKTSKI